MTVINITASEPPKPATPVPAAPQQQTQGNPSQTNPPKPADKPSEQQK